MNVPHRNKNSAESDSSDDNHEKDKKEIDDYDHNKFSTKMM